MIDILIAFWLTITPPANLITDSTQVFVAEFKNNVSDTYLLNKNNFTIKDESGNAINIIKLERINELDNIQIIYTKIVAFQVLKPGYGKTYSLTALNYGTKSFFNYGFAPNLETEPKYIIKK